MVDLEPPPPGRDNEEMTKAKYEQLLTLRTGLRRFLRWSEAKARAAGLTPTQHQLLLAVRGHPGKAGPTIGEIAEYLEVRPHSASELVGRAAAAGLVVRGTDANSGSLVRVNLTLLGAERLRGLSAAHLQELAHLAPTMQALWRAVGQAGRAETLADDRVDAGIRETLQPAVMLARDRTLR